MKEKSFLHKLVSSDSVESTMCFCVIIATIAGCIFPFVALFFTKDFLGVAAVSTGILAAGFGGKFGQELVVNKWRPPEKQEQCPPKE